MITRATIGESLPLLQHSVFGATDCTGSRDELQSDSAQH